MFEHICVPVDLAHADTLHKALRTAADLATLYGAKATLMAVTSSAPSEVARNPQEFAEKLSAFAARASESTGTSFDSRVLHSNDLAVDMEKALDRGIHESGVDLVVMASHVPTLADYVFRSHSSYLARHTDVSVFIVR